MTPIVSLHLGDSVQLLGDIDRRAISPKPDKIFKADACVTDPPYGFDFAGGTVKIDGETVSEDAGWDSFRDNRNCTTAADDAEAFAKFTESWVRGVRQNLWPGAHVVAFTAAKTLDLLGRGMRLAQLDIVRSLAWFYGAQGQVKSKHDLRPGYEPLLLCRFFDQVIIGRDLGEKNNLGDLTELFKTKGRGQLHAQTWKEEDGQHPTDVVVSLDETDPGWLELCETIDQHAAAFFVAKPTTKDRDSYCGDLPVQTKNSRLSHMSSDITGKVVKPVLAQNPHPTPKPIELMRRLVRLVSRPGHTILDPFMGSGSTGIAAVLEGRNFIGIERDPDYFKIASTRVLNTLKEVTDGAARTTE